MDNEPLLSILDEQEGPVYDFSSIIPLMVDIRLVSTLKVSDCTLYINEVPHTFTTNLGTLKLYHTLVVAKQRYKGEVATRQEQNQYLQDQLAELRTSLKTTLTEELALMAQTVNTLKSGGLEIVADLKTECLGITAKQFEDTLSMIRHDSTDVFSDTKDTLSDLTTQIETLNKFIQTPITIT